MINGALALSNQCRLRRFAGEVVELNCTQDFVQPRLPRQHRPVGTEGLMHNQDMLDALLCLPVVWRAKVSPDGKWVAWSWVRKDDRVNVYAQPTNGSGKPIKLTDSDNDLYVVSFAPDSRSVIVEGCPDGNERIRLFTVALDGSQELRPLTEENPPYFIRGGQLHPNGRYLVYGANYDFERANELSVTAVWRHDLGSGKRKLLAMPARSPETTPGNQPQMNAQGTHVLYFRADLDAAGQQVWLTDINGRRDREILNFGATAKVTASWFPDGKRILFLTEAGHYRKLGVYNRVSGSIKWLVNDPQRNIEHAHAPDGTDLVVCVDVVDAREHASLINPRTGEETAIKTGADVSYRPIAPAADGGWIGLHYGSVLPTDVVRADDNRKNGRKVVNGHKFTSAHKLHVLSVAKKRKRLLKRLVRAEDYFWKSVDGLRMHGFLYRAAEPIGTILVVHGGPRDRAEARFDAEVQYLVSEGFNVLAPNYRGSTGYGLNFQDAIKADGWGGREQEDIASAIRSLVKNRIARWGKVGITGISYGGYSSWHAITHYPTKVVAAAAPVCGMTDLVVDYNTTRPDLRTLSQEMMGGTPDAVPERYFERSPINYVANIRGKLLIVQGGQDPNVTPENVKQVRKALKKARIRYQLLEFDNEGHEIIKPENEAILYASLARFFKNAFEQ